MADVCILEPGEKLRKRMKDALQHAGHHCGCAKDVAEGFPLMCGDSYKLIVLNARLPWRESFTLLKTLAKRGWPVLFITSDVDKCNHLQALYQGTSDVLLFPLLKGHLSTLFRIFCGERIAF